MDDSLNDLFKQMEDALAKSQGENGNGNGDETANENDNEIENEIDNGIGSAILPPPTYGIGNGNGNGNRNGILPPPAFPSSSTGPPPPRLMIEPSASSTPSMGSMTPALDSNGSSSLVSSALMTPREGSVTVDRVITGRLPPRSRSGCW